MCRIRVPSAMPRPIRGGEAQTASSNVYIGDDSPFAGAAKAACQKGMAKSSMPFVKG
jgi:hypothetical protein